MPRSWPRQARAVLYGHNDMATGRPSFFYMAFTMLTYPIWLVQVCHHTHSVLQQYAMLRICTL